MKVNKRMFKNNERRKKKKELRMKDKTQEEPG